MVALWNLGLFVGVVALLVGAAVYEIFFSELEQYSGQTLFDLIFRR